jgi:hypothetical protein
MKTLRALIENEKEPGTLGMFLFLEANSELSDLLYMLTLSLGILKRQDIQYASVDADGNKYCAFCGELQSTNTHLPTCDLAILIVKLEAGA